MPGAPVTGGNLAETLKLGSTRDPLLGRVLGSYRIQARVGEGTGLPSYLAEHVHLDRQVLFKLFHPPRGEGEAEAIRQAIQQARQLSALKHDGVLPLVEIAECGDGFMYVVLELSGARPLPALLAERGPLPWTTARVMGRQIAAALLAAETASLAGAEPTASQIFVTLSGPGEPRARVDLVTPESLGWVPARSPDQARGVGRLLYAMLAGHEPPDVEDHPLPDLGLSSPEHDIPADADALVMRAVDPEPARRWPDLATLHRELGGRDRTTTEASPPSQSPATSSATDLDGEDEHHDATFGRRLFARPSRPALIAGGVGVLAAIIVALAIVSGPNDSDSAATRVPAEKFKVTSTIPPPQPMVLPPPPVPAPEPEATAEADGAVAVDGGVATAPPAPAAGTPEQTAASPEATAATAPGARPVPGVAAGAPAAAAVDANGPAPAAVGADGPAPAAVGAHGPAPAPAAVGANGPAPAPAAVGANGRALAPAGVAQRAALPGPVSQRPAAPASPTIAGPASPAAASASAPAAGAIVAGGASPVGAIGAPGAAAGTTAPGTAPPATAAPSKQGAGSPCTLSLGSIPWSDVQIDGQRAGFTPVTDYPVACGTHEILFTSPERGLARKISLSVRPGEKVKRIVDLGGPKAAPAGASSAAPASRPPCRVTLGSKPWSEIWIDGNRAGTTPLVDYPVSCGTHDVLFLSRDSNVQHRESLTVQSTLKRVITLVESN